MSGPVRPWQPTRLAAPLCVLGSPESEAALRGAGCELAPARVVAARVRGRTGTRPPRCGSSRPVGPMPSTRLRRWSRACCLRSGAAAIDLAAAPGGKTAVPGSVGSVGAKLSAADRHLGRALLLRRNLRARHVAGRGAGHGRRPVGVAAGKLRPGDRRRPLLGHGYAPAPSRDPLAAAARAPRASSQWRSDAWFWGRASWWRPEGTCSTRPARSSRRRTGR